MPLNRSWPMIRLIGAAAGALLLITGAGGAAQTVAAVQPSVSAAPSAPALPEAEMARLREGLAAAQLSDWSGIRAARAMSGDPLVRKILTWRLNASLDSDALFAETDQALRQLVGWPGRETMRRKGEQTIFDSSLNPADRATWLTADGGPLSGDGEIALALAYSRLGRTSEANTMARAAWRERSLTPRAESIALASFGGVITRDDHADRVDRLLWRDERGAAQRLLSRLGSEDRAVAEARIALQQRKSRGLQKIVNRVPVARSSDPGLLYDRARYMRRDGRPEDALPVVARIKAMDAAPTVREALFEERRLYIPRALKAGQRTLAYNMMSDHGLTGGEEFADSEWMAGWIALRFLKQPGEAAKHFAKLDDKVSTPVSKSRALYWRAEAMRALGQKAESDALFTQAAAFNYTYYGQLAAVKHASPAMIILPDPVALTGDTRAAFESKDLVRALRLISAVGDRVSFELLSFYLDDQLDTPAEHEMLAEIARQNMFARTAVRSAKAGIRRGIVAKDAAFPLIDLPAEARRSDRPEPALILAIARQESEFDPAAVSPVGARGLMQLMPATARLTAARTGVPYEPARLTDANYNMTLGSAYLQELIDQFGGSYVLAIASYNAGPSRAHQWMSDWGDPRSRSVDAVDWVELIPFAETRNYVQRVLENLQVYRHRLAGAPTAIRIDQDLKRGG